MDRRVEEIEKRRSIKKTYLIRRVRCWSKEWIV